MCFFGPGRRLGLPQVLLLGQPDLLELLPEGVASVTSLSGSFQRVLVELVHPGVAIEGVCRVLRVDLRPELLVQILIHIPDGAAVERPLLQVGGDALLA